MKPLPSRREVIIGAGVVAVGSARPSVAEAVAPYAKWFKYNPALEESWSFASVDSDPNHVSVRVLGFETQKAIRVLALYPRASSAYDAAISKMLDIFDDKGLHLDIDVINYAGNPSVAKDSLEAAEKSDTALVIAMGSEATALLWEVYRGGAIPVVTVCSKDPVALGQVRNYTSGTDTNFAFTSLNMSIDVQMAYTLQVKPRLRNIGVVVDATNVSAVETQAKPLKEYANTRGIRVIDIAVKDPKNAREELTTMVSRAVAAMERTDPTLQNSILWITGSTSLFDQISTIQAEARNAAIFSAVPDVVRAGDDSAALSIGVSFESNAHLAAIYATDILQKKVAVGALPVGVVSPPDIAINFRRVRAIGMKVPFNIFESAATIYNYDGRAARINGVTASRKL